MIYGTPVKGEDGMYHVKALTQENKKCFIKLSDVKVSDVDVSTGEVSFDICSEENQSKIDTINASILSSALENSKEWFGKELPEKIINTQTDETVLRNELPVEYVTRMAVAKNRLAKKTDADIVLSADTIVAVGRSILGKPKNSVEARQFLDLVSGRRHKVMTGLCLFANGKYYQKLVKTTVRMKRLSGFEKERYLLSDEWQGKAGGYAIQGSASYFFPFISSLTWYDCQGTCHSRRRSRFDSRWLPNHFLLTAQYMKLG